MADYENKGTDIKLDGIDTVEAVLNAMTEEERVNMLVNAAALGEKYIRYGAAGTTYSIDRLGVPLTSLLDGPIGIARYGTVTAFPSLPIMASTWDTDLIYEVGQALGYETVELGFDCILGPGMNILRNPLGGRNADYFSEDPVHSGLIATAYINGVQDAGALADVKHFIANVAETIRERNDSIMSERALREVYLRNFEIAVKRSNPGTIMTTYNLVNNKFVTQNPEILKNIVRNEWGYEGVIVTDWFAGAGIRPEEFDYDSAKMIAAGSDILYPGSPASGSPIDRRAELREWMNASKENYSRAKEAIRTILTYVQRTPTYKNTLGSGTIPVDKLEINSALSRRVLAEGAVLLKNEDTLPLKEGVEVAVFGDAKYNTLFTGGGSAEIGAANRYKSITIKDGLLNAGLIINATAEAIYGGATNDVEITQKDAQKIAAEADVCVYAMRKFSAEWADRRPDTSDLGYYLPKQTIENLKLLHEELVKVHKKLVFVINSTGPIDTEQWGAYADAIIYIGAGGNETGNALADILVGKVNPSGKLNQTFPKNYFDVPGSAEFPGEFFEKGFAENPENNYRATHHDEGIYVGYKYFDTFCKEVSFPFGYGLSYTEFSISDIKIEGQNTPFVYAPGDNDEGIITIKATVTNTGKMAGKEVVQAYVHMVGNALETPLCELKAFAKTKLLSPGESETVTLKLDKELLKYYDDNSASWVIPSGEYEIRVGNSSFDVSGIVCMNVEKDIVILKSDHYAVLPEEEFAQKLTEIDKRTDGGAYILVSRTQNWDKDNDAFVRTVDTTDKALKKLIIKGLCDTDKLFVDGKEIMHTHTAEIDAELFAAKDSITIKIVSDKNPCVDVLGQYLRDADTAKLIDAINTAEEKLSMDVTYETSSKAALLSAVNKANETKNKAMLTQKEADNEEKALREKVKALKVARQKQDAYKKIYAHSFDDKSDFIRVDEAENGTKSMGYAVCGQWLCFSQVDFSGAGACSITLSYGMPEGTVKPAIAVVLDDKDAGDRVATCSLGITTGAWHEMTTESFKLNYPIRGVHDVYVLFSEGNNNAPCNLEFIEFEPAKAGDVSVLSPLLAQIKELAQQKYNNPEDEITKDVQKIIKDTTRAIDMANLTQDETKAMSERLMMAVSEMYPLYFAYTKMQKLDLDGFEKIGADKVRALLTKAKGILDANDTEGAKALAPTLNEEIKNLVPISGHAYNPVAAATGATLGEPYVNDNGRIRAINGQAVVAYFLEFGDRGAQKVNFSYKNPNGVMANVKLMVDKPTAAPIAVINLPKTEDEEIVISADLSSVITGHRLIYLTLTNTQDIAYGISEIYFS